MKLFKLLSLRKKKRAPKEVADFFLHASDKEKKRILMKAAKRSNADQRALIQNSHSLHHKIS